jgi:Transposase DNA-binding
MDTNTATLPCYYTANYHGAFGDERLSKRGQALLERLAQNFTTSVRSLAADHKEQIAYYRFLNNEAVSEEILIEEATSRCAHLCQKRPHVLCVQDTSEVNLRSQRNRLKMEKGGVGRLDSPSDKNIGFKLHVAICFDPVSLAPLGYADIDMWHRPLDMPTRHERAYSNLPIEDKESYKWIRAAKLSKEVLKGTDRITFIEDMEADIFEQFLFIPDAKTHLLVRSNYNRKTVEGKTIKALLGEASLATTYEIQLPTDYRRERKKRTATLEVRFIRCTLAGPEGNAATAGKSVQVCVVEAKEINYSGSKPVYLRLLTTHSIQSAEQAMQIIDWYGCRWYVEQVFRLLKKEGFNLEDSELENGYSIRKLCVLMLVSLLKVLQMNIAYHDPGQGQPLQEVFSEEEVKCLKVLEKKYGGQTKKQSNRCNPTRTKWAAWIIGRLGGWKGYDSQGRPGVIALKKGLVKFNDMVEGFRLARDM